MAVQLGPVGGPSQPRPSVPLIWKNQSLYIPPVPSHSYAGRHFFCRPGGVEFPNTVPRYAFAGFLVSRRCTRAAYPDRYGSTGEKQSKPAPRSTVDRHVNANPFCRLTGVRSFSRRLHFHTRIVSIVRLGLRTVVPTKQSSNETKFYSGKTSTPRTNATANVGGRMETP